MSDRDLVHAASTEALKAMGAVLLNADQPQMPRQFLMAAEGVVAGAFLMAVRLGGDEFVLDVFLENVRLRVTQARLGPLETQGEA